MTEPLNIGGVKFSQTEVAKKRLRQKKEQLTKVPGNSIRNTQ